VAAIAGEKAGIIKPGMASVVCSPQAHEAAAVLAARCRELRVPLVELAAAARACALLGMRGFAVPPAAVAAGFAGVRWPGRLEQIAADPAVILDGAHNPLAARALAAHLDAERARGRPAPVVIYGSMRDKAVEEICELLFPRASAVVLTAPRQPRALSPAALASACGAWARSFETAPDF